MKTCSVTDCQNICEGTTDRCSTHNRLARKISSERKKEAEKQTILRAKSIPWYPTPKKIGTTNTWGCSSGKRVTQFEIIRYRDAAYNEKSKSVDMTVCEGCGGKGVCWAHIIPQATCKNMGKTELIWHLRNIFRSCYNCNSAIENPSGSDWKSLKNIDECLSFIKVNAPVLHQKFLSN